MTTAEYGQLAVAISIYGAATAVFALGFDIPVLRQYFGLQDDPRAQSRYVRSAWVFLTVTSIAASVVLAPLVAIGLSGLDFVSLGTVVLSLVGAAAWVSATTVPFAVLRATGRVRSYMLVNLVGAVVTTALTFAFVVPLGLSVNGWMAAAVIGNVAMLVWAIRLTPLSVPPQFDSRAVRRSVRVGVPLLPHFLSQWGLQLANRIVLAGVASASQVGMYSLAANLAIPLMIAVQSLNQAVMPRYAQAGVSGRALRDVPTFQIVAVCVLTCIAAVLGPLAVSVVAPPSYEGAESVIPWIVLGYGFLGLYHVPMNGLSLGVGRTSYVAIPTVCGAVATVALTIIFTPTGGIVAAGIASAVGYLVLLLGNAWLARDPRNPVRYEWRRIIPAATVCAIIYAAAEVTSGTSGARDAIIRVAWLAVLLVVLYAIMMLSRPGLRRPSLPRGQ